MTSGGSQIKNNHLCGQALINCLRAMVILDNNDVSETYAERQSKKLYIRKLVREIMLVPRATRNIGITGFME
jgi:hypothetical protein